MTMKLKWNWHRRWCCCPLAVKAEAASEEAAASVLIWFTFSFFMFSFCSNLAFTFICRQKNHKISNKSDIGQRHPDATHNVNWKWWSKKGKGTQGRRKVASTTPKKRTMYAIGNEFRKEWRFFRSCRSHQDCNVTPSFLHCIKDSRCYSSLAAVAAACFATFIFLSAPAGTPLWSHWVLECSDKVISNIRCGSCRCEGLI